MRYIENQDWDLGIAKSHTKHLICPHKESRWNEKPKKKKIWANGVL